MQYTLLRLKYMSQGPMLSKQQHMNIQQQMIIEIRGTINIYEANPEDTQFHLFNLLHAN